MINTKSIIFKKTFYLPKLVNLNLWSLIPANSTLGVEKFQNDPRKITRLINCNRLMISGLLLQGIHALFISTENTLSLKSFYLLLISLMFNGVAHILIESTNKRSSTICDMVIGLIDYPNRFREVETFLRSRTTSILARLGQMFSYSCLLASIVLPLTFTYGAQWFTPCSPSIVGFWAILECVDEDSKKYSTFSNTIGQVWKLLIFMVNHWSWAAGIHSATISVIGIGIWCTQAFQSYIHT